MELPKPGRAQHLFNINTLSLHKLASEESHTNEISEGESDVASLQKGPVFLPGAGFKLKLVERPT